MRKSLIVLTMTLGICSLLSAQVGINTADNVIPKVTLQIDGKPDVTTVQDGVLIPRLTRTQLKGKDAIYLADQNGTLIFVSEVSGASSPKTADITSTGFYYYDSNTSKWVSISPAPTVQPPTSTNVTKIDNADYTLAANDDILLFLGNKDMKLHLPVSTSSNPIPVGRTVYVSCSGSPSASVDVSDARESSVYNVYGGSSAVLVYTGDTSPNIYTDNSILGPWSVMSGF